GQAGFTARDLASSLLVSLSGSFQTTPTFFLNWQNGVSYNLATQTPQYRIQSLQDLENIPLSAPTTTRPGILADVASITRSSEMAVLSHYNIRRVVDVFGAVQDRDLGAVGRAGRHPGLPVPDRDHPERSRPDGRHHEHRRRDRQQHPAGVLRARAAR